MTDLQKARARFLQAKALYLLEVRKAERELLEIKKLRDQAGRQSLLRRQAE